jgi:hypothetical protein
MREGLCGPSRIVENFLQLPVFAKKTRPFRRISNMASDEIHIDLRKIR